MRIHAQNDGTARLLEDNVANGGAGPLAAWKIAVAVDPFAETTERLRAQTARIVVHHDELQVARKLRIINANGLDGEIDAIEVIERGHADAQPAGEPVNCRRRCGTLVRIGLDGGFLPHRRYGVRSACRLREAL